MQKPRILLLISEDWYFWSHRRALAEHLMREGYAVEIATSDGRYRRRIESAGMEFCSIGLQRSGKNPLREALTVARLVRLFRARRPDIVHLVGMKPILYGSLAARICGVPGIVCAIAGWGWLNTPGGLGKNTIRRAVCTTLRCLLRDRDDARFIVQNSHHCELLLERGMAAASQISLIAGAGVDVHRFRPSPEPLGAPTVVMHGRMLWDKGIGELVEAARVLRKEGRNYRFLLVGDPDPANPSSISMEQLRAWQDEGVVQWQPRRDDIPRVLASAHVACLPSYHEGFPLALVEAAACGRAIVATDIPGCRDVVADGTSGLLVPSRDVNSLTVALRRLLSDSSLRRRMGRHGRQRVVKHMSTSVVNADTLACYERLLGRRRPFREVHLARAAEAA